MGPQWRIEMMGQFRALAADRALTRFRTQKTGALLAYLAFYRDRLHPRELLIDTLWPGYSAQAGRHSLSQALSSLRNQFEPPGVPAGAVILADRLQVGLNPQVVTTDVAEFEAALATAARASEVERLRGLMQAVELYRGELLPGYYEDWVGVEQRRLAEALLRALGQLVAQFEQTGELERALDYARRAVQLDPLREESQASLIRLYAAAGQPAAALRQYRELEQLLNRELGVAPNATLRNLARELEARAPAEAQPLALNTLPEPTPKPDNDSVVSPAPERMAATQAPPPKTESGHTSNLPLAVTRFFGREEEIARLQQILLAETARLVTLTGVGGSGKTRLALETARQLLEIFGGSIWFVPLATVNDARLIADAMLEALRLPRAPGLDPLERIAAKLAGQPALLLLDNFDQLAAEGAPVVQTLLEQAPLLKCLVTSRVQLNLMGERVWPVAPLPIPNGSVDPERLLQLPSVALFVDRAQAVRPDFQITTRNAATIAQLCKRLEGLPLALELAAARAQVLTPAQMLDRLQDRFTLLVSRARYEERHRTLRAAIDWSYQMLTPELQRVFAQHVVFRGGWTLEAAEAVCDDPLALDHLAQLGECSLVLAEPHGEEMRFGMLETLREYAAEVLSPEDRAAALRRHAEFYLALAEAAEAKLTGPEQVVWLQRLADEYDNLRAAFEWSQSEAGDREAGLRLAGALYLFLIVRAPVREPLDWLLRALAAGQAAPAAARLKALAAATMALAMKGEGQRAIALSLERIELCRALGDERALATSLVHVGWTYYELDDFEQAETHLQEALTLARAGGNLWSAAFALTGLSYSAAAHGDYEVAEQYAAEGLRLHRQIGSPYGLAHQLCALGRIASGRGQYATALADFRESIQLFGKLRDPRCVAQDLEGFAAVYSATQQEARAVSCFGCATALRQAQGTPLLPGQQARQDQTVEWLRQLLGEAAFAEAWQQGQQLTFEQAVVLALDERW
jgi:predicted ATPase/DNA-binding SARP family transcriptional activator